MGAVHLKFHLFVQQTCRPGFILGIVAEIIPLAVARDELKRIDAFLNSPQLLIGGLAVQQYYANRDSADIDLVCSINVTRDLIDNLYDTADFEIENKGDEYRPSWVITETGEGRRIVYLGFKITERDAYKYVDYAGILKRARRYRHGQTELTHIKVPMIEDLALLKLLSLITRFTSSPKKGEQDLKDFINLINNKEFRGRVFLDLITNDAKAYLTNGIAQLQETRGEPLFANSSPARLFGILFPPQRIDAPPLEPDNARTAAEKMSKEPAASAKASNGHLVQLREAAGKWAGVFSSFLNPDWAVHLAKMNSFDTDEGLISLRAHFPKLNGNYSDWRAMNVTLRGIETMPYWMVGGSGDKPTTDQGQAELRKHNELVRAILSELSKIEVGTSFTGECDQCRDRNDLERKLSPSPCFYQLIELHHKYHISPNHAQYLDMDYTGHRIIGTHNRAGYPRQSMIWTKPSDKLPPFEPNDPPTIELVSYTRSMSGSAELNPPRKCSGSSFALDLMLDPPLRDKETIDFSVRGLFPRYRYATAALLREATRGTAIGERDFDYASWKVSYPTNLLKITVDLPTNAGIEALGPLSSFHDYDLPANAGPVADSNQEYSCTNVVESGLSYIRMHLSVKEPELNCRYRVAWRLP